MSEDGPRQWVAQTAAANATEEALESVIGPGGTTLATIWATVDLERTLAGRELQTPKAAVDTLLGARVVVIPGAGSGPALVIAEPSTEGRLAATLARNGEGPIGRYVAVVDDLDRATGRAAAAGISVSRRGDGPFGASILVISGSGTGPHLILCNPAVPSTP